MPSTPPASDTLLLDDIPADALDLSEFEAEFADRRPWRRILRVLIVGFVAFLVFGNLFILAASAWAKLSAPPSADDVPPEVAGIRNFDPIDTKLWRGGAPSDQEYLALGAAGVSTVIDLRAEDGLSVPTDALVDARVELVSIPIRDGQAPTPGQVQRFLEVVADAKGTVYVHCGAGVGRTGTMAAAYRVAHGGNGMAAMLANLTVGPPSLEQLAFAASLDAGEGASKPNTALVALSRTLDAPRRIWKVFGG